ncbi:MAG TPA: alpha/beta hydrolase, partial [Cyanobacteria bacterium UBA11368]|nr:alpha/beta hydrolase [Cyanobacteria bacterium UBA11368]
LGVPHAYDLTAPTAEPHVLVFIHGWLLSRQYWQPLIDLLSPTYQCLCYDLRGFGDSQPIPISDSNSQGTSASLKANNTACRYAPAAYARDLGLLLERL